MFCVMAVDNFSLFLISLHPPPIPLLLSITLTLHLFIFPPPFVRATLPPLLLVPDVCQDYGFHAQFFTFIFD